MAKKILVVFYSRTGTTKKVAEELACQLNADIEEITDLKYRDGVIGFIFGGRDAVLRRNTEIGEIKKDPSKYDLVVVGSPVWGRNITPAARTYMHCNKDKFGKVACFCTMGGENSGKIFDEFQNVIGKEPVAKFSIRAKEANMEDLKHKVKLFSGEIERKVKLFSNKIK